METYYLLNRNVNNRKNYKKQELLAKYAIFIFKKTHILNFLDHVLRLQEPNKYKKKGKTNQFGKNS